MSREKQIEALKKCLKENIFASGGFLELAEALYSAGFRNVKKGSWKVIKPRRENRNATYICSVCGALCSSYYNDVGEWKFCPHCGAKMKGE